MDSLTEEGKYRNIMVDSYEKKSIVDREYKAIVSLYLRKKKRRCRLEGSSCSRRLAISNGLA